MLLNRGRLRVIAVLYVRQQYVSKAALGEGFDRLGGVVSGQLDGDVLVFFKIDPGADATVEQGIGLWLVSRNVGRLLGTSWTLRIIPFVRAAVATVPIFISSSSSITI